MAMECSDDKQASLRVDRVGDDGQAERQR